MPIAPASLPMGRAGLASVGVLSIAVGCTHPSAPVAAPIGPPVVEGNLGTAFHVWAPHASGVAVEGDFNSWSPTANPLGPDGDGTFSGLLPGVTPGARYRYALVTSSYGVLVRNDPAALSVLPDLSSSVVYDPGSFAWGDGGFSPPPFSHQVIYELHLATFVDSSGSGSGG